MSIIEKVLDDPLTVSALENVPDEEREKITESIRVLAEKFETMASSLMQFCQEPDAAKRLREELIRPKRNEE
jgi:hypothetical protein